jgi:translation elongation factor TU
VTAALRPLTLGTAGHIDHGKTTLVKAMTGRDTDRLKEEKERGISIELGFAELTLPSGRHLSVVDVPGHERFVKTMVAGATGIDLFLLVVAADDGVMPQTREHLRIIELLGIPAGVVALTKVDMVDRELAELARADVEEFLESTRYAESPIVLVSGVTGEGLPELLAELDRAGGEVPPRLAYPATRMPVDRVFSLKGIGTVVTGTLWSGTLSAEDVVSILPPRTGRGSSELREVRVRSIQVHDREVDLTLGGQRVALNLTGVARQEIDRGQWVVKDPAIEPTYLADARLSLLEDTPDAFPRVFRARVDHGTAEVLVKVVLADRESLAPGEEGYAQFRFEEQVLLYPGDQFIVRSVTPVTTIGGGQVIDPGAHKHGTGPKWRERLTVLEQAAPDAIATLLLEEAFPSYLVRGRLEASPYLWRFAAPGIRAAVAGLLADGRAVVAGAAAGPGGAGGASPAGAAGSFAAAPSGHAKPPARAVVPGAVPQGASRGRAAAPGQAASSGQASAPTARLFHGPSFFRLAGQTLATLTRRAETDTLNPYMTLGELRRELAGGREWPALDSVLEHLLVAGDITRSEHGYRVAGAAGAEEPDDETTTRLLAQFAGPAGPLSGAEAAGPEAAGAAAGQRGVDGESGLQIGTAETPSVAAAAEAVGVQPREAQRLVDALVRRGRLVKVGEDLYYSPDRLEDLMARLAAAMEAAGQLTLAEARDLLGTSRRFAQALLEHMDSEGMTLRVGDARRLRRRRR